LAHRLEAPVVLGVVPHILLPRALEQRDKEIMAAMTRLLPLLEVVVAERVQLEQMLLL
jgi:hypothetical protein